jgi:glucose-1-phosphatase
MLKAIIFDFVGVLYAAKGGNPGELNRELIEFISELTSEVDVYIFTTETILLEDSINEIKHIFKQIFRAKDLGMRKDDPESYKFIAQELGAEPHEMIFIDDMEANVQAADQAGLTAWQFSENFETIRRISRNF